MPDATSLTARLRRAEAVADLARRALAGTAPIELVTAASEAVADLLGVPMAGGFQLSERAGGFLLRGGAGFPAGAAGALVLRGDHPWMSAPLDGGVAADFDGPAPEELAVLGVAGGVASPIARQDDGPARFLAAFAREPRVFTEEERACVASFADVLSGALYRARSARDLRESEARASAVLETSVDAVITIDADGTVLSFNPAAERIFGYAADEVVGRNIHMLMPEPYHSEHDGYLRAYVETGRKKIIGVGREVTGLRKSGETFPMDLAVSEVVTEGRRVFTGLVRDITDRRMLERELLRIQTEERQRIGQDLHDGLGQMLTGTGLIAQQLARRLAAEGSPAASDAEEIVGLIREADQHARSLARGLVPVDLEKDGLPAALARLTRQAETLFAITCTLDVIGPAEEVARTLQEATHLYRIAQEAISNAVRHGRARRVAVTLAAGAEQLRLRVEDDGTGIAVSIVAGGPDRPAQSDEHRGMGVRIMHYRARILGGTLEIRPGAERGTVVTCTVPLRTRAPVPQPAGAAGATS